MLRARFERLNQRLSIRAVARAARLSEPVVCLIELGRLVPTDDELTRIANALGLNPPSLLLTLVEPQPVGEATTVR